MEFPFKSPVNIDLKNTNSTITTDTNVFPQETNKITTVGRIRQKKYYVQCNGNGHMNFNILKDPLEQIRDLSKLHEDGIITYEEFTQKKEELLKKVK